MDNIQIRLPDSEMSELDDLAMMMRASRSEAARAALREGILKMKMEIGFSRYLKGELSLSGAAAFAGVSIHRMADHAADMGVDYLRYDPDELIEDSKDASRAITDGR